jgi:hypothetical protein
MTQVHSTDPVPPHPGTTGTTGTTAVRSGHGRAAHAPDTIKAGHPSYVWMTTDSQRSAP